MRTSVPIAILVVLATAGFAPTDPPYTGKWKLNLAKSDFGQVTVLYEPVDGGGFKVTVDGLSYTLKTDGKDTPTPWGTTTAWKSINASTWEAINRANGMLLSTDTVRLSADGKTLTVASKVMKASGETSNDGMTFHRISGGPGLAGKWQAANLKSSSPGSLEIAPKGADGLILTFVDQKGVCDAKLDGKEFPAAGPMWPAGWTCALSKHGDHAFDVTWKKDGKAMYRSTFTASADGKTLTETGGAASTTEKIKAVYDRQ